MSLDTGAYLQRIGFGVAPTVDLATLTTLQRLHMTAVPFENLDIVAGHHIPVDAASSVDKIVERRRGGWCFEVNGAFAELLRVLGFDVLLLGAAVLHDGPNRIIEHLGLEVMLDQPYLVDVGFGDSFIRPLALSVRGPQDGGNGRYEFFGSPEGTTLARLDDGVPVAQYRFKRVAHTLDQFTSVSDSMQIDPDKSWKTKPFATRLLDGGPDRVTLTHDRVKLVRNGVIAERRIPNAEWMTTLHDWFGVRIELAGYRRP